jgi:hypothetical protein
MVVLKNIHCERDHRMVDIFVSGVFRSEDTRKWIKKEKRG